MLIVGIDPGLKGGIAFFWPQTGALQLTQMPVLAAGRGKKSNNVIDRAALAHLFNRDDISHAFLETASIRPLESGVSALTIGKGYGLLLGTLTANFVPITEVPAATWKKRVGVTDAKDSSVARASSLFPRQAQQFRGPRGGLIDGIAEAALIAWFGARTLTTEAP